MILRFLARVGIVFKLILMNYLRVENSKIFTEDRIV